VLGVMVYNRRRTERPALLALTCPANESSTSAAERFPSHPNSRNDTEIVIVRRGVNRPEFECCRHPSRQHLETTVTSKQLEKQREAVKAQIRWAMHHGGDEELLNLLRIESDRLFMKKGECPDPTPGAGLAS
jgi:hypothetical protein